MHHFLDVLGGRLGDDEVLVPEDVVRVEVSSGDYETAVYVANRFYRRFLGLGESDQTGCALQAQGLHRVGEAFGLGRFVVEAVEDFDLLVENLTEERGLQSFTAHPDGHILTVVAGMRTEGNAALAPKRRTPVAGAGAAGVLLRPGLLARTGAVALGLGLMRTEPTVGLVVHDRLMKELAANLLAQHLLIDRDAADLFALLVVDVQFHRSLFSVSRPAIRCVSPRLSAEIKTRAQKRGHNKGVEGEGGSPSPGTNSTSAPDKAPFAFDSLELRAASSSDVTGFARFRTLEACDPKPPQGL